MKDWIFKIVVKWLADYLTVDVLNDWAAKFRITFIEWTDKGLDALEVEAKKSETLIDDIAVAKLRVFRDQLIPVCEVKI